MFKSKLQELCQKKGWQLPEYQTSKGDVDHEPRFLAKVNVNGQTFLSPGNARSSKQAQNEAAQTALNHFTAPPLHPCFTGASAPPLPSLALTMQGINLPAKDAPNSVISTPKKFINKSEAETAAISQNLDKNDPPLKETTPVAFNSSNQHALMAAESFLKTHFQDSVTRTIPDEILKADQSNNEAEKSSKRRFEEQPEFPSNKTRNSVEQQTIIHNDNSSKVSTMWKNRLQEHCQRNMNTLPTYTCQRSGPDHCSRFNCKVIVNGQVYASESHFPSIKEAESDAARIALMSMPSIEAKTDDTNYKNLLQELAQKSRLGFPAYTHCSAGDPHNLTFVSTVQIADKTFTGEGLKTKKAADMSAAKVAYKSLMEKAAQPNVIKEQEEPINRLSNVVSFVQNNIQPKIGGNPESSSGQGNSWVNSQIRELLEKHPLCRKGVVVYPKELEVSLPDGCVESIVDDKWIITSIKTHEETTPFS